MYENDLLGGRSKSTGQHHALGQHLLKTKHFEHSLHVHIHTCSFLYTYIYIQQPLYTLYNSVTFSTFAEYGSFLEENMFLTQQHTQRRCNISLCALCYQNKSKYMPVQLSCIQKWQNVTCLLLQP